jgi:2-phosphosulfolactate phosphatase
MQIHQATLENCHTVTGAVVAIDVLRAFTTAAYALAAGATELILVSSVEEALTLRKNIPGSLIVGEVDGFPFAAFDFNNSPSALAGLDLSGRPVIQRTSAGTQGIVHSQRADILCGGSFVCANATARYLRQQAPPQITFVITGILGERDGDEDIACADYMTALLQGQQPNPSPYLERVGPSTSGRLFSQPDHPAFPSADLERCLEIDRFDFALVVKRESGLLKMRPVVIE